MKNRLSVLAAGTALCAIMAAPATAGYTIYVDNALPSVLFVEFDAPPESEEPTVISAPGEPADVVVIGPGSGEGLGGAPEASTDDEQAEDGGEDDNDNDVAFDDLDLEPTLENLVEDQVREDVFQDIELR